MSTLTDREWNGISNIIFDIYNSNIDDFRISFFENIKKIIHFDLGTFFLGQNKGNSKLLTDPIAYNHPFNKVKDPKELFQTYNKLYNLDYGSWLSYQQETTVMRDTDILSDTIREKSEIYKNIFSPVGMHYCCTIYIIFNGLLLGTANLFRSKENQDFTDKDLFILNYIKPHLTQRMYKLHPQSKDQENIKKLMVKDFDLTEREFEIVLLICQGHTNKEIASKLFITENTIKKHVLNIYKKMNIDSRSTLMKLYFENLYGKVHL